MSVLDSTNNNIQHCYFNISAVIPVLSEKSRQFSSYFQRSKPDVIRPGGSKVSTWQHLQLKTSSEDHAFIFPCPKNQTMPRDQLDFQIGRHRQCDALPIIAPRIIWSNASMLVIVRIDFS